MICPDKFLNDFLIIYTKICRVLHFYPLTLSISAKSPKCYHLIFLYIIRYNNISWTPPDPAPKSGVTTPNPQDRCICHLPLFVQFLFLPFLFLAIFFFSSFPSPIPPCFLPPAFSLSSSYSCVESETLSRNLK